MRFVTYLYPNPIKNHIKAFLTEKMNILKSGKIPNSVAKKQWWAVVRLELTDLCDVNAVL